MSLPDLPAELVERGVWWQIAGFALVSAAGTAVLVEFEGSQTRAYQYFETAAKTMYWANVFALIGLFEGVRRMFEKASELRARYREQAERKAEERGRKEGVKEGRKEGVKEGRKEGVEQGVKERDARWNAAVDRYGVEVDGVKSLPITPEVQRFLDGEEG